MGNSGLRHHHVTDHFREKSIVFRDTRDSQEHDAKNRLSIPSPSPSEPVAEVESVKKKLTLEINQLQSNWLVTML